MKTRNTKIPLQKFVGVGFTIAATGFILWAGYTMAGRHMFAGGGVQIETEQLENKAIERLRDIAVAQDKYKKTDWDEDGKKEYAMFLVHLWQSVSEKDSSTRYVGLIDEELAFVSDLVEGIDGYQYDIFTLRDDGVPAHDNFGKPTGIPLDFSTQWAAVAYPLARKEPEGESSSSRHPSTYVVCCGNKIYKNADGSEISTLPGDMESGGWTPVETFK